PATTAATGLHGRITDPRTLGDPPRVDDPDPVVDDFMLLSPPPPEEAERIEIIRGPNIKEPPIPPPLPDEFTGRVLIVLPDNVSTGSMAPDGAIVMADRSNVPAIAEYTFMKEDAGFVQRAKDWQGGFIVGGDNYGQGSSREHAALAPLALGIRCVLAQGFARIHRRNLIAQGLLPLTIDQQTHDRLEVGDQLSVPGLQEAVEGGSGAVEVRVEGKDGFTAAMDLSPRERNIVLAGGVLNQLREQEEQR
ncbi:MAG TPA: aconitate hydratase, partial [Actinomycetota bacterium]|nr:aconitate hydratase [Actinomycetota bacterium]